MARFCDLPNEVLEEIMSWLPPESLKQFKCVCKPWYVLINSLMNDTAFVAKHLCNMKIKRQSLPFIYLQNLRAIHHTEGQESSALETYLLTLINDGLDEYPSDSDYIPFVTRNHNFFEHDWDFTHFEPVLQCNGIICLSTFDREENIVLLNPALRELKLVSNAGRGDGSFRTYVLGLGYDCRANDYKVVAIKSLAEEDNFDEDGPYQAEVYTLSTNSWKDIELNVEISHFTNGYQLVNCKGVCYCYYWQWTCTILSFDVADEVFQKIYVPFEAKEVPRQWDVLAEWTKIAVWNESLVLFFYPEVDPIVIHMWIMDSQGAFLTKYLTIGPLVGINYPLAFYDDELLMKTEDDELILYNLPRQQLNDHTFWVEPFDENRFVTCERSLVSLLKREGR